MWFPEEAKTTKNRLNNGLEALTKRNKQKEKGWLRELENAATGKQTNEAEKRLTLALAHALRTAGDTAHTQIAHAWGVSRPSICNVEMKAKNDGMNVSRKCHKDAGDNVFNSDSKREAVFTVRNTVEKIHRQQQQATAPGEPITSEAIGTALQNAAPELLTEAETLSTQQRQQSVHLVQEITCFLRQTNGSIAWVRIAACLAGNGPQLVEKDTVHECVMSSPNLSCQTTRIHPLLNEASRKKRLRWAHDFWLFWNNANVFFLWKKRVFPVHMDEKWFFAVVARKNNKCVPFLGVAPVQHAVQHKSHICKVMALASSGNFPFWNDMERGGAAKKVSLVRVGRMQAAAKDSHRRVHHNDGSFTHPKTPNNTLHQKGDLHFTPMEMTGSTEGTEKKPKFSLLKFHLEDKIPHLEDIAKEHFLATGEELMVRCQLDGAGPHMDQKLINCLKFEFAEREWVLCFQPPNSPLTNIKDACIFPAMSKAVTAEQGLSKGGHVLQGEELWSAMQKCWNAFPEETIARSFLHHHQMVNAIIRFKGEDSFAEEHKGLHCNVRKHFVAHCDENATIPSGAQMAESLDDATDMSDMQHAKPLDSDSPDLATLPMDQLEALPESMDEDVDPEWDDVATAIATADSGEQE